MRNKTSRRMLGSQKAQVERTAYLIVLPAILLLLVFNIAPIVYTIRMSFFEWSFYKESTFIGFENYRKIVFDGNFWSSIGVGFEFTFWNMSISMLFAFAIALCIRRMGKYGASATKVLVYIPTIIAGTVISYIFGFMYNYRYGILNTVMRFFGVRPQTWTSGPATAMFSVVFPSIWQAVGVKTLILLAGMNEISPSYYEAASLDGAGAFKQMWYVTLPCLRNVAVYLLVTGAVSAMQMWDLSNFITGGGPQGMTTTPVLYIYNRFRYDDYLGPSLAAALILAVVLGCISWIVFKTVNSDKNIDG